MMKSLMMLPMAVMFAVVTFAQAGTGQSGPPQPETTKPKPLAVLQGTWVLTSADGEDLTSGPEIAVTITNDQYVQTVNGDIVERGQIKLDEAKKPMQIDLIIQEGNDAGKTQMGVIEVTGAKLRGKLSSAGDNVRPTDFEPADGFFAFTAVKK